MRFEKLCTLPKIKLDMHFNRLIVFGLYNLQKKKTKKKRSNITSSHNNSSNRKQILNTLLSLEYILLIFKIINEWMDGWMDG